MPKPQRTLLALSALAESVRSDLSVCSADVALLAATVVLTGCSVVVAVPLA